MLFEALYTIKYAAPTIRPLYMDTDSLILCIPNQTLHLIPHIINISPTEFGAFKDEYPKNRILEFQALAPKFYYMRTDEPDEQRAFVFTAKGMIKKF